MHIYYRIIPGLLAALLFLLSVRLKLMKPYPVLCLQLASGLSVLQAVILVIWPPTPTLDYKVAALTLALTPLVFWYRYRHPTIASQRSKRALLLYPQNRQH
jgi:hypothetical protein